MDASYWIEKLGLQLHPEGGAFAETYRSPQTLECSDMGMPGNRNLATCIYFLLKAANGFSAFHRIKSDECWHFYTGNAIMIYEIDENGHLQQQILGNNPENGEVFQHMVKANRWFAARVLNPEGFALVGCTVAPGFDFQDFELAVRSSLIAQYPSLSEIITELTYA